MQGSSASVLCLQAVHAALCWLCWWAVVAEEGRNAARTVEDVLWARQAQPCAG